MPTASIISKMEAVLVKIIGKTEIQKHEEICKMSSHNEREPKPVTFAFYYIRVYTEMDTLHNFMLIVSSLATGCTGGKEHSRNWKAGGATQTTLALQAVMPSMFPKFISSFLQVFFFFNAQ